MRKISMLSVFLIACALAAASCSQMSMPSSPSALGAAPAAGSSGVRLTTRDDPPAPAPDPTAPTPDPTAPAPDPTAPIPAGTPGPMALVINIVSYFGSAAFNPNPTMANVGDSIVFTNTDSREHHIVLDDGTEVGDVMPGASTAPLTLTTPTASFHCTIHPTMVGTINMDLPPDPSMSMPPDNSYYGYY